MRANHRTGAALLAAVALALGAAGCGGGDKLEGSVGNSLNLDFDHVNIALQNGQYLIVEYVSASGECVAELTVDTFIPGCEITPDQELDFGTCAFLDRTTLDSTEFAPVTMGMVTLFQYGSVGDRISGTFSVLFDNGLGLTGDFGGTLEERNG